MQRDLIEDLVSQAAAALRGADGLLVTAGAGMGVDSGLPDFRGNAGFWQAYPALGAARLDFTQIANPAAFQEDPRLAWGFYGHRLRLYRETRPHPGFAVLQRIAAGLPHGAFVFTSNVDGQFQRAGFAESQVCECHGSIHHLQCLSPACSGRIWPATGFHPEVDEGACRLLSDFPSCPDCGNLARPNILMFGDWGWLEQRTEGQQALLAAWLTKVARPVVIELGAGTAIPTVRRFGERIGCPLIRINPDETAGVRGPLIRLPLGAQAGLERLAANLG